MCCRALRRHMRTHRQFVTLVREHAQLVAEDEFVINLFEKHCYIGALKWVPAPLSPWLLLGPCLLMMRK